MGFWKSFSFFCIYPTIMMGIGFVGGVVAAEYFYPGEAVSRTALRDLEEFRTEWQEVRGLLEENSAELKTLAAVQAAGDIFAGEGILGDGTLGNETSGNGGSGNGTSGNGFSQGDFGDGQAAGEGSLENQSDGEDLQEAASLGERLNADTDYVLEETDLRNNSVVETTWKLPAKYIGMNREEFLLAMDSYEASPPLSELERGFVDLEVLSFSRDKVVVKMNYEYVEPSNSFYLVVQDDYVVVYLDDKHTIYMHTDILLKDLPEQMQQDIIGWMYVPDEESLYNFLETYSS